jgi:SulP family sulfate permease
MASGLTEGLLTINLVDEITGTRGNGNRECIAQGSANILNGFSSEWRVSHDSADFG